MTLNAKRLLSKAALAVSLALTAQSVMASGYQINEYSASGLGRAFAGDAAMADNASTNARNAAAIFLMEKGTNISMGATYIDPDVNIYVTDVSVPAAGGNTGTLSDGANSETVPNFHITSFISDDIAVGYSATATFGMSTDYGSAIAGIAAGKTSLTMINHNINGAYKIDDAWSVALGANAASADASLRRYDSTGALPGSGGAGSEYTKMDGDDWGYGWNFGVLYQLDDKNRFGFTYRSKIDLKLEGHLTNPAHNNEAASMDITLPASYELSGFHQVREDIAIHYSLTRTNWSVFKEMKAVSKVDGSELFKKEENWSDTWRIALGSTLTLNQEWALRAGIAFDESPVDNNNRTMSIPDTDRFWWSAGTTYKPNNAWSFDFGFAYLSGKQYDSSTETVTGVSTYTYGSTGDAFLYGLQASYQF